MCAMAWDWKRLGDALAAAREGITPRVSQEEAARTLGLGRSTIQKMERGHPYQKIQPSHRVYARWLGWTDDSIEAVLSGGEPTMRAVEHAGEPEAEALASPPASVGGLSVRILEALTQGGPLLDSDVIKFRSTSGREVTAVVVARTEEGTPEELSRDLREFQARMEAMRSEETDDSSS